ncbi:hypothetical protein C1H87_20485 [Flavivirga eckloniae]|uniref:Uncharacterized protein n=2 Tax=Flavivirga eckloniae TaxID=1803846 RepID=A0A2K9PVV4_9FLAO|nr:hypothetical protein C1H87_20485 [Flavivirga eckloniae]
MITLFVFTLTFFASLISCDKEEDDPQGKMGVKGIYKITENIYTLYADNEKFIEANDKRGQADFCQVKTEIHKVKRVNNILTIEIYRPKNCNVKYEIIWDGAIMESHPSQAYLYVHAIAENCNDLKEKELDILIIDLEKTIKDIDKNTLKEIYFTIKDSCSLTDVYCTEDCNVTVTNG